MEEKKNTNNIILIVIGLILVAGVSLFIGINIGNSNDNSNVSDKTEENNTVQEENTKLDENKVIQLTNKDKIELNKNLNNQIPTLHMNLIGEHTVNKNVFSTEKEKYEFVYWYLIHIKYSEEKNSSNFKEVLDDKINEYRITIKLSYIHQIYNKIFNSDFDDSLINEEEITSDKYVYTPMAWGGGYPGTLKANKLLLNEKTGEYSLYVDILAPNDLTVEIPSNPFDDEYVEYDSSLIISNAIIKYKEINSRKVLTSWIYTK